MTLRDAKPPILFVALSMGRGGTERHLAGLLPRLATKGWPVSVYCLLEKGELADSLSSQGVEIIEPPFPTQKGKATKMGLVAAAIKLGYRMLVRRYPIVHFFLPAPYLVGAPLAILTQRPIRIMSRRSLNHYQKKYPLAARFERYLHRHMTSILANSKSVATELIELEGCAAEKVHLIYNGVDISEFRSSADRSDLRRALKLEEQKFVATVIANLIPYKGHADLIIALSLIKDQMPKPFCVLCAGRDNGYQKELEQLAAQAGVTQYIRFLGARTDIPSLLRASDVGILCSHEEGFSNAVLESMAAGLPMIVTDVGGNPEAVRHEIDGLVVPSRSPSELGAAILDMAGDSNRRAQMANSALRRVRENFEIGASSEKYISHINALLEDWTRRLDRD